MDKVNILSGNVETLLKDERIYSSIMEIIRVERDSSIKIGSLGDSSSFKDKS